MAVAGCRTARQGFAGAICYWNDEGESRPVVGLEYLKAVTALERAHLDCSLSLKATAVDYARGLMEEIGARAAAAGFRVHLDSMWPESVAPTFALLTELAARQTVLGCTLPGRWQRSVQDADVAMRRGQAP
jgi:proline dehydrogenase